MRRAFFLYRIRVFGSILTWLFPPRCAICDQIGRASLCEDCRKLCESASQPMLSFEQGHQDLEARISTLRYEGPIRTAVLRFKHSRVTALGAPLARLLAEAYATYEPATKPDVILPVPIHWRRWCVRGFNQAEWLCKDLPQEKVVKNLVRRVRYTRYQFRLSPAERESNLKNAFQVHSMEGKRVLLVDDIYTTGATARELARTVKAAGATWVGILTLAVAELDSEKKKGHPLKVPPGSSND